MPAFDGKPFRPGSGLLRHEASFRVGDKWHTVPVTKVLLAQQPRSPDTYFFPNEGGAQIQLDGSAHIATHMVILPTAERRIQTFVFLSRLSDGHITRLEAQAFMTSSP